MKAITRATSVSGRSCAVVVAVTVLVLFANGMWAPEARPSRATPPRGIIAFELAEADLHGLRSLKDHGRAFTHLFPRWFHLTREEGDPLVDLVIEDTIAIAVDAGLTVIPTLDNVDERGSSHPDLVRAILADPERRADVIKDVAWTLDSYGLDGIDVHFDGLEEVDQPALATFLAELSAALKPQGRVTIGSVTVHAADPERLQAFAALLPHVDYLRVLISLDAGARPEPGPDAPTPFFTSMVDALIQVVPPERLIAGISMFGHAWPEGGHARAIDFPQAMALAHVHGGEVAWQPDTGGLRLAYEQAGTRYRAHVDDAPALSNKLVQVEARGLAGVSFARLGAEDPSLWARLAGTGRQDILRALGAIPAELPFQFVGSGEIVHLTNDQVRAGRREIALDPASGLVTDVRYTELPVPYVLARSGVPPGGRKIALTFDDGPSREWTPQVLDLLARYQVQATFFMVGRHAVGNRDLVRRAYREGHELANHTFTHTMLADVSEPWARFELNATRYVIAGITDRDLRYFRSPLYAEANSFVEAESPLPDTYPRTLRLASQQGYLSVGNVLDPNDWRLPGTDWIITAATDQSRVRGYVILLHDSGGDRRQTLEALPAIIESYQAQGFEFTTVSGLIGMDREFGMPPIPPEDRLPIRFVALCFAAFQAGEDALYVLMVASILLSIVRIGGLACLALIQYRRPRPYPFDGRRFQPFVSVLVPAYNEQAVIGATIESLLRSDYENFEVLVIDDGSKDDTLAVARRYASHPAVRVISKENGGKASALNLGVREARGEVLIAMDADTVFDPRFISYMLGHFRDPTVGAVSGNAKVGNRRGTLAGWQSIEYITNFNLDRRAYTLLNCITVVPGAAGAWRKRDVLAAGGFGHGTLAEDADLTISVRRLGRRIVFEDRAIAWTEAPETVQAFIKQRRRWSYGTLQVLWKHRDVLLRPRFGALGMVAFPSALLYLGLSLVGPAMDAGALWFLSMHVLETVYFNHEGPVSMGALVGSIFWSDGPTPGLYYAAFILTEWVQSILAFRLDREHLRPLLAVPAQRFVLRWLMYFVLFATFLTALKGFRVGWGKLERTGVALGPVATPTPSHG